MAYVLMDMLQIELKQKLTENVSIFPDHLWKTENSQ